MPTEPTPHRSPDELLGLVQGKAAAIRQRRQMTALGASVLVVLLLGAGVAVAGNGGGTASKRTVRVAGASPTTVEETTTSTEPPTTTTSEVTTTTSTPATTPPVTTTAAPRAASTSTTVPVHLTVEVSANPSSAPAGTVVQLTAHIRDGAGEARHGTFDFGDGSQPIDFRILAADGACSRTTPPTDEPTSANHTYGTPGHYTARVTVTDEGRCSPPPTETVTAEAAVEVVP